MLVRFKTGDFDVKDKSKGKQSKNARCGVASIVRTRLHLNSTTIGRSFKRDSKNCSQVFAQNGNYSKQMKLGITQFD